MGEGAEVETMTPRYLQILQHALGLDQYGQGEMHRNHFCAGASDEPACRELVALGYMATWRGAAEDGSVPGYPYFNCSVTEDGKTAVRRESPAKLPKRPRAVKRPLCAANRSGTMKNFQCMMRAREGSAYCHFHEPKERSL
jgi:hypothetical protein